MGLNDTYSPARSNMLMINPLPSVSLAYSLLMQDELQKEASINSQFPGNSAFFLASSLSSPAQYEGKGKKNTTVCSFYKKFGHTVDKCYRIIGFPTDFKFTKSRRGQGTVRRNTTFTSAENRGDNHSTIPTSSGINQLSQDQFSQLVHLLNQVKSSQPETSASYVTANCAGKGSHQPISCLISLNSTH
ncbi:hypothetical protein KY290_022022 [Solanum tuberosum]|uniref:Uncharacterized protein n=1 Tax=Solanum tuberosum TaxID=4113 RepID=A0ABQ7V4S5_SOLTU|nr:hypothetical protein KY289_021177 [Solanum tuberosum]KAH0758529.1 hypothetical protein KY290_022022 [Solanum tuberosum]